MKKVLRMLLTVLLAAFLVCGLCGCELIEAISEVKQGLKEMHQERLDYLDGLELATLTIEKVRRLLRKYNIEIAAPDVVEHDINVYAQIEELKEDDLIGYYELLGEQESEKIVRLLGYESWNDYLIKHDCLDEDGNPNIYQWVYNVYMKLADEHHGAGTR